LTKKYHKSIKTGQVYLRPRNPMCAAHRASRERCRSA